ncbi:hypothetical protein BABINDRAFT_159687 [Babjeviella inositovora NRRL Y-12698]|uniref:Major facilitator superfamily (MFS) profile domain-containing protein n=1 Tax=Babjeviella inositovora NRRL Y-12698 TaxID=984486 RepID=A0A1E3R1L1_9ASCO|nr:uncharacterized protein BABINDRAFT_159687 [Babjeviella inositovora NRRL Y-12698]ODQ83252.1 hypothetical protein BABINDRAFT_159687 [Babjeviella inositovora NRRL Y-12698]
MNEKYSHTPEEEQNSIDSFNSHRVSPEPPPALFYETLGKICPNSQEAHGIDGTSISTSIDNTSIRSQRSHFSHVISRINSSASQNPLAQKLSLMIDAVRDDNLITEKQRASDPTMDLMPETGLSLVQSQLSHQASRISGQPCMSAFEAEHADTNQPDDDPSRGIPDGGYSWVIAACCCLLSVATWGSNASYGVFLNYYLSLNYFPGATSFHYAMIGGLVIGTSLALSPFVFIFVSYLGLKPTMLLGIVIQTAGYMLASVATNIWQLFLTQGLMIGISFALIATSSIAILPNWFYYKRALAAGLTVSGAGIGGIIFSLSCQRLMEITGNHRWPLRMVGVVTFFCCVVAVCLIKQYPKDYPQHKIPFQKPPLRQAIRVVFNPKIVTFLPINIVGFWFSLCNIGYITLLYSMSSYASSIGLTRKQGSNVTAVMNLGQVFGRPGIGYLSDKLGRINFSVFLPILFAILIFAFWINATSYGSLIAWAFVCGLTVGCASVNNQPMAVDIAGIEMFPAAFSYMSVIVAFPLTFAEVIALELKDKTSSLGRPFLHTQILCGIMFLVAGLSMFILREWKIRKVLRQRQLAISEIVNTHKGIHEKLKDETIAKILKPEEVEVNDRRLWKYRYLLRGGVAGYFSRMMYPIKV